MGQGSKTNKISEMVDASRTDACTLSAKTQLQKARDQAAAAAAEAERIAGMAERGSIKQNLPRPVESAPVDVSEPPALDSWTPAGSSAPSASDDDEAKVAKAAAADALKDATTAAFKKAIAEGLSKDAAKEVARKAGKAAFKMAMQASPTKARGGTATQAAPNSASTAAPPLESANTGGGWVSAFGRPREMTVEESAEQARAKAQELAERAERMAKSVANAKKKTSHRSNRL
jgi:hypothetical protein